MKLNIGLVLPGLKAGGGQQVVLELACEYRNAGHDVEIISLGSGGDMIGFFKKSGIKLKELSLERKFKLSFKWPFEVLRRRKKIRRYIRKQAFDVIHTFNGP